MASVADCDDDGTSRPCSEPTCWELPTSSGSETPNPRPTKTIRMESLNPPHPSSSEVVAPTPVVDNESKKKPTPEWRAEPEGKNDVDEDDDLGMISVFFTTSPDGTLVFPDVELECEICGGDHVECSCAYLTEFPAGGKLLNEIDYIIVCDCGLPLANDGRCSGGKCVSWRPKRVLNKTLRESNYQHFAQWWHSKNKHS